MNHKNNLVGAVDYHLVDVLCLLFLGLFTVLILLFPDNIQSWQGLILDNVRAGVVFIIALWCVEKVTHGWLRWFIRSGAVILLVSFIYGESAKIINIFFDGFFDELVMSWELAIFGEHPTVWFERFTSPFMTEWMMFAYVIYVPMIPFAAWLAQSKHGKRGLENYLLAFSVANLFCYLVFILFPVKGPMRTIPELHTIALEGYLFTWISELIRQNIHFPGGCLPSPHCAIATVILLSVYKHHRPTFWVFLPIVLSIYVSTVYGRFHYVSDGIVGIPLGVFAIWAAPKLNNWWGRVTLVLQLQLKRVARFELEET